MEKLTKESALKSPELRQATDEDCLLMFRLQHLNGEDLDDSDSEQVIKYEQYKNDFDGSKIQVIVSEGIAVGRLRVVREEGIYIGGFQILPQYRGLGIGTAVLSGLVVESEQNGMSITLEVFNDNSQAIGLYKKIGFVTTGENDKQKIMKYEPSSVQISQ